MKVTKYYCDICKAEIELPIDSYEAFELRINENGRVCLSFKSSGPDLHACPVCIAEVYIKQKVKNRKGQGK